MRILFTGASSFTGHWFVRQLAENGHDVTATFRRTVEDYGGTRRQRVEALLGLCRPAFDCTFGEPAFLRCVEGEAGWDLLCHHAAEVSNYRSPDFDAVGALASNTRNLDAVLAALAERGCRRLVLTGSVFEGGEGAGSDGLPPFSPYGLSKGLTAEVVRFAARRRGFRLGKFVISNPFGPLEEPRFTTYLVRCWFRDEVARVNTPDYVRDNIHVSLLARAYTRFAEQLAGEAGFERFNPSGYVESQGAFARRFAAELSTRLGRTCRLELAEQRVFDEPRVRINTDVLSPTELGWSEVASWDALADYYRRELGSR